MDEYWYFTQGLEALHYLTRENRIANFYLEDHEGNSRAANFSNFHIDDANHLYTLHVRF